MNIRYRGKVTRVGKKYLTVVLWRSKEDEELVADVDKNVFPLTGYRVGQIFDYFCSTSKSKVSVTYELVKPKPITNKDLTKLRMGVERQLKGLDMNI